MKSPKKANLFIVTAALVGGFVSMGAGGWLLYQDRGKLASLLPRKTIDEAQLRRRCLRQLKMLGIQTTVFPDGRIRGRVPAEDIAVMENPKIWFDRFSIGILGCGGYTMTRFCAGVDCKPVPFYMILEHTIDKS